MSVERQELLDLTIVTSQNLKNWMVEQGADQERVEVSYINIDLAQWQRNPQQRSSVREELGISENVPLILYAARLTHQKQPKVFAKTMLHLHQSGVTFKAVVAGDGPDFKWLQDFVSEHKLGHKVHLLGVVANKRVRELLNAADIFFLPSQYEGIALVLFEAMAMGVVPVGAAVDGQPELVTPECGILLPRSTEDEEAQHYAHHLTALINDPTRRRQMQQAGYDRLKYHFRLDQMGERMVSLLEKAKQLHTTKPRPVVDLDEARTVTPSMWHYFIGIRDSVGPLQTIPRREFQQMQQIKELTEARNWLDEQYLQWHYTAQSQKERLLELETRWIDLKRLSFGRLAAQSQNELRNRLKKLLQRNSL